jgi:16S rRNA (cytosine967-C5)-methyltransferase
VVVPDLLTRCDLDARDRHLVTELVYGTCRMQRACDWLVDRHLRSKADPEVRCALRLGAYQLGWTRIPPHAAVDATVAEVDGPGRSVVNAVLRRVASELQGGRIAWPDIATELSYPDWVIEELIADLGTDRSMAALRVMNEAASPSRREDGYTQDLASQMVGWHLEHLLGERIEGSRILDLCAAPGGKSTALASPAGARPGGARPGPGEGVPALVVAADVSPERTRTLASNIVNLAATNAVAVVSDGRRPPFKAGSFDLVLVDAPCSGLGVLRRRPDARWRVQPEHLTKLAKLQRSLVREALPLVKPGGVLAYSVCTLTAIETAAMDNWIARTAPDLRPLAPPAEPWTPAGRGALLLPQAAGTDGMYLLALEIPATHPIRRTRPDSVS